MGPVESKNFADIDYKTKRSAPSEVGSYEPDMAKNFLLEGRDRKLFLQTVSKASPKDE